MTAHNDAHRFPRPMTSVRQNDRPLGRQVLLVAGSTLAFCLVSGGAGAEEPDYAAELPRIAATEASAALATFKVAEPFELQLVAAEPLVGSPVAIEWDADGAMYVCEMRGYSENQDDHLSRVSRLTDEDGDGVYDRRTEFAAGLAWPTGLFPYDGGLFVGDAPNLYYFKDQDGDGIADLKQLVLTGFGTSNVQGLMNSFRWDLDNRIHIACSSVGGEIRPAGAPNAAAINIRGRDLALDPRSGAFEPTSGAAQHGMCFDDWGRKFVSSNSDHIQQVMYEDRYIARNPFFAPPPARISIAADGPQAEVYRSSPVEPWRIVRTRLRVSGLAKGPIEGGGRAAGYFTGATGVTIYRGDAWPAEFSGLAVIGDVGSNLIHRKRLEPNGLEFIARRIDDQSELVASTDTWFRPAQFVNAPDGSLHVIDVYREVIEHPLSLPPAIKQHLDLTSGRDRGRIYRLVPKGYKHRPTPRLANASAAELVETLTHANAWHRETAQRLLYERQPSTAIDPLRRLARGTQSPLGRMHSLYCLQGLNALDEKTLLSCLGDSHAQLRRHAIRLVEKVTPTPALARQLAKLVDDDSLEVRYQLAFTLASLPVSMLPGDERAEMLFALLGKNPSDRWMRAAVFSSLGDDAQKVLAELSDDPLAQEEAGRLLLVELKRQIELRERAPLNAGDLKPMVRASDAGDKPLVRISEQRQAIVSRYQAALSLAGDVERGREHFKKNCSGCHRVENFGHELGPNLATIQARGAEVLLTAVLDPNREVNPQYLNYAIALLDGRIVTGVIADEGATSLTLRRADNATETLLRIDIEDLKSTGLSIMPEGFENTLDIQAMADLISYLLQAR
ncbi:MAG: PVC-type heme-binding CxxCH protein [Planctomycetaceae bacterium]